MSGLGTALALAYLTYLLLGGGQPFVRQPSMLAPLLSLYATLTICDLYRQRFYIRRRIEWGLHWRALILRFAKWPWLLRALLDAIHPRRGEYEITLKRAHNGRSTITRVHALTGVLIASALVASDLIGTRPGFVVELLASGATLASLAIAASAQHSFPPPYDPALPHRMTRTGGRDLPN